jgi:hypothetical protein
MITLIEAMTRDKNKGRSLSFWVKGFYLQSGGPHGFDIKIPIFDFKECKPRFGITHKVLIDYLGSFMWININVKDLHYGYGRKFSPSKEGKDVQMKLEAIRLN